jgi:hypothetical protein
MSIIGNIGGIALAFYFYYCFIKFLKYLDSREKYLHDEFHYIKRRLENMEQALESMERKLDWLSLPQPLLEDDPDDLGNQQLADYNRFESDKTLTADDVRKWKPNQVVNLMTKGWFDAVDEPLFDEFEYKHDHMEDNQAHGFKRCPGDLQMAWVSFYFIVGPKDCCTLDGGEEVRRAY